MYDEHNIRELLIASCHSSIKVQQYFDSRLDDPELLRLLWSIAKDEAGYLGDAPMQAAYYLSKFPPNLLRPYETELLAMLSDVDGYGGHIAVALGKVKSDVGKQAILKELGDGSRFDAWLFRKALRFYELQI